MLRFLLTFSTLLLLSGCLPQDIENDDLDQNSTTLQLNKVYTNQNGVSHNQGLACANCHGQNSTQPAARDAKAFELGGTLFSIQDAPTGTNIADLTNYQLQFSRSDENLSFVQAKGEGNFYYQGVITANNYRAQLYDINGTLRLSSSATHGVDRLNCNACHTQYGTNNASGRIYTKEGSVVIDNNETNTSTTIPTFGHTNTLHHQGENCVSCHASSSGGSGKDAISFEMGGSLMKALNSPDLELGYDLGEYIITLEHDSNTSDKITLLMGKGQGNFYATTLPVDDNYTVYIHTSNGTYVSRSTSPYQKHGISRMQCNTCHSPVGTDGAPGRIFLPLFATVVHPIFNDCQGCHASRPFRVNSSNPQTAYNAIISNNFHSISTPSSSRLLLEATNSSGTATNGQTTTSHDGGQRFSTLSTKYKTIKEWMLNGALDN